MSNRKAPKAICETATSLQFQPLQSEARSRQSPLSECAEGRKTWLVCELKEHAISNRAPQRKGASEVHESPGGIWDGCDHVAAGRNNQHVGMRHRDRCGRMPSIRSCRAGESTRNSATLLFLLQIAAAPGSTYHPRVNCGLIPSDVLIRDFHGSGLYAVFHTQPRHAAFIPVTYSRRNRCNDRCARFHGERVCEDSRALPRHDFADDHIAIRQHMNALKRTLIACVNAATSRQRRRVIVWNRLEYRVHVKIRIEHRDRKRRTDSARFRHGFVAASP